MFTRVLNVSGDVAASHASDQRRDEDGAWIAWN